MLLKRGQKNLLVLPQQILKALSPAEAEAATEQDLSSGKNIEIVENNWEIRFVGWKKNIENIGIENNWKIRFVEWKKNI